MSEKTTPSRLDDNGTPGETSGLTPETPQPVKKKWIRRTIVAGGIILVVVAGAMILSIIDLGRTAQATAEQYFAALAAGDATTANSLTQAGDWTGDEGALLTDEFLATATERISDVTVTPGDGPLDSPYGPTVQVSYSLAGQRFTTTLVLVRGEPEWGVLRTWQLRRPFAQRAIFDANNDTAVFTLGGAKDIDADQILFPGVYPVAAVESTYFEVEETALVIDGLGESLDPTITFKPTAVLTAEVQRQVNADVDACAASISVSFNPSEKVRERCSLTVEMPGRDIVVGMWKVTTYPVVSFRDGGGTYQAVNGNAQFTPAGGGEATDTSRGLERWGQVEVVAGEVRLGPSSAE